MLTIALLMAMESDRDREIEAAIQRRRQVQDAKATRPTQSPGTPRPTVADSRAAVVRRPSSGPSAL
jgi:hypothetical protein